MRSNTLVATFWMFALLAILSPATARAEDAPQHRWRRIYYQPAAVFSEKLPPTSFSLQPDEKDLRFDLVIFHSDQQGDLLPALKDVTVRLHAAEGRILDTLNGAGWAGGTNGQTNLAYIFPWARNSFDEGWIELRVPGKSIWFEIPYGFTRNPADALSPIDLKPQEPVLAPAMKTLGASDLIVPWLFVEYELGAIQNGESLSLRISNRFDSSAEIVLYRDGGSWDLHTPRTSIEIKEVDGSFVTSTATSIRSHTGGHRRSDTFHFGRNPRREGRCWGTASIKVDDKTIQFVVPSSLFRWCHGVADLHHKARIPYPTVDD